MTDGSGLLYERPRRPNVSDEQAVVSSSDRRVHNGFPLIERLVATGTRDVDLKR
jgi:hypothetical protein